MKFKTEEIPYELNLTACAEFFLRRGYHIHDETESELVLFKPGSVFAASVKRIPLELSLSISSKGSQISLAYGTWILFDTGDLKSELSRIISSITYHKDSLV